MGRSNSRFLIEHEMKKITYKKARKLFESGKDFYFCPSGITHPGILANCELIDIVIRELGWESFAALYAAIKRLRCNPVTGVKLSCYVEAAWLMEGATWGKVEG